MAGDNSPGKWWSWFRDTFFDWSEFISWVGDWGISRGLVLISMYAGLFFVLSLQIPSLPLYTYNWLAGTAPLWVPVALAYGFWAVWVRYVQSLYLSGRDPVLLEMKIPREVVKSPRAMELALTAFSISSGEVTYIHRGWRGQVRPFFSLEIASFGGDIHFYIWCWRAYKDVVEGTLYAYYPEVELVEVEDYATKFRYDPDVHSVFGTDWKLESNMDGVSGLRTSAYPLKSYIDFELDKDPKEEFKVDPLADVLEFMGSLRPDEQVWAQIVLRKAGKKNVLLSGDLGKDWVKAVKNEVNKIRLSAMLRPQEKYPGDFPEVDKKDKEAVGQFPNPSERQRQQLVAMERHLGKYPFEVGMRGCYISTGDFRGAMYSGMRWMWRPYGNPQFLSHLRPSRWHNPYDYPWQDFHDIRYALHARRFFDAYRRRMFYHTPWIIPTDVMTNETLASLWHPPSRAVTTPGIERMGATKAAPPANLPT